MTVRPHATDRRSAWLPLVPLLLSLASAPAAAATKSAHPVVHPALASHPAPRRLRHAAQDDPQPSAPAAKKGRRLPAKPGQRKPAPAGPSRRNAPHAATKAAPNAGHRRLRPQDEADNDPPVLVRTKSKHIAPHAASSRPIPAKAVAAPSKPSAPANRSVVKESADSALKPSRKLTSADFTRAAASGQPDAVPTAMAEMLATGESHTGESHPDETERITTSDSARSPLSESKPDPAGPSLTRSHARPHPATPFVAGAADDATVSAPATTVTRGHATVRMPDTEPAREAVVAEAMNAPLPTLYGRGGRLVVPPPMKGTHEILAHQNEMADNEGLTRIQDDEDLNRMRAQHLLVALGTSATLDVNPELPANRRYARPWTARFVADIARNFSARFGEPLRLNSAVRTVSYQRRLQRVNGNAAGIDGDTASPHLTGQAIDFGKRGMSVAQIAWMRSYLMPLMQAGTIDVEEEFQQACFHISVYRSYLAAHAAPAKTEIAKLHKPAHTLPPDESDAR